MTTDDEITEIMLGMVRDKAREIYSDKVIEHGVHPKNFGTIKSPDGYASSANDCGETLEIFFAIRNGKIEDARFITDGCLFTIAAGSAAAHLAVGRSVRDCIRINQSTIIAYLEGVPENESHCAFHAAVVLHRALRNYAMTTRTNVRKAKLSGR